MTPAVRKVDLRIVVDLTSSMSGLIATAKEMMTKVLRMFTATYRLDLQVAIIGYRDHPGQDATFASKVFCKPTDDLAVVQRVITKLDVEGGGDRAESVFDGLRAAAEMEWREGAERLILLIGDAEPHGAYGFGGEAGDKWGKKCPCGDTFVSICECLEFNAVQVIALALTHHAEVSFKHLADFTGGFYNAGSGGTYEVLIAGILKTKFEALETDAAVYEKIQAGLSTQETAEALNIPIGVATASKMRLRQRGLV